MDKLLIEGGHRLSGSIPISGAKNAALPLMTTAIMTDQDIVLEGWPDLADTRSMITLLNSLGILSYRQDDVVTLKAGEEIIRAASYDVVRRMRASILVLGPLLARFGEAKVSLPGGCAIGARPVDLHIMVMKSLGAAVDLADGYVIAHAPKGLVGNRIVFPTVSVGATENALLAASLARGQTVIVNAAREPEISDLARCLIAMGAKISGHGTDTITVDGVLSLSGCRHRVIADRIEAGTFAIAAAITGGEIALKGVEAEHLSAVLDALISSGARIDIDGDQLTVSAEARPKPVDITTDPFPGFPTDLQAQFMALMCVGDGAALISETIFENRFMHVPELARMGADVSVTGGTAFVRGVKKLRAAPVMATDLRASVSLVLAGLVAEGKTHLSRVYHLDRGYHNLEQKLNACGAHIRRVSSEG